MMQLSLGEMIKTVISIIVSSPLSILIISSFTLLFILNNSKVEENKRKK